MSALIAKLVGTYEAPEGEVQISRLKLWALAHRIVRGATDTNSALAILEIADREERDDFAELVSRIALGDRSSLDVLADLLLLESGAIDKNEGTRQLVPSRSGP